MTTFFKHFSGPRALTLLQMRSHCLPVLSHNVCLCATEIGLCTSSAFSCHCYWSRFSAFWAADNQPVVPWECGQSVECDSLHVSENGLLDKDSSAVTTKFVNGSSSWVGPHKVFKLSSNTTLNIAWSTSNTIYGFVCRTLLCNSLRVARDSCQSRRSTLRITSLPRRTILLRRIRLLCLQQSVSQNPTVGQ